jgi:hypothetical protein
VLGTLALGWRAVKRPMTDGNPPTVEKHVHGMWLDVVGLWNEGAADRRGRINSCGNLSITGVIRPTRRRTSSLDRRRRYGEDVDQPPNRLGTEPNPRMESCESSVD